MAEVMLSAISGPPTAPIELSGDGPRTLGRSGECDIVLTDPAVSRRHAVFERVGGGWTVFDTGSRHGVHINGIALKPGEPAPISAGDRVRIGPWMFRVRDAGTESSATNSIDDTGVHSGTRVSRIELGDLAERRLESLMRAARAMQEASDESAIARVVTEALAAGTGYERVALVRPIEGIEVVELLSVGGRASRPVGLRPSRTLLEAAREGGVVRLEDAAPVRHAESIISAGVTSAMCAPVRVGDEIDAYLYLDGTGAGAPHSDAGTFCAAIADLCGMALSSLRRREVQARQDLLMRDLNTARDTQRRLMPAGAGRVGPCRYTLHFQPGRVVAGDFFGVREIGDHAAVCYIGDVAGKGLGASLVMASIVAMLDTLIDAGRPLEESVAALNRYVAARTEEATFATLFVGVLDLQQRSLTCVDAGHGYVALRDGDAVTIPSFAGGPPVGADAGSVYESATFPIEPGTRLVLISDGVPEQADPSGAQFGTHRIVGCLAGSSGLEGDVACLLEALSDHAAGEPFGDDVTVASIELVDVG